MRPPLAWSSATCMISSVMPAILMSICSDGDAVFGAGHLEVHVAQVIFVTQNVGQHGIARRLPGSGPWRCRRSGFVIGTPASISASDVPQTVAIDDEPLDSVISETTRMRVGELLLASAASDGSRARQACHGRFRGGPAHPCGPSRPPNRAGSCSAA